MSTSVDIPAARTSRPAVTPHLRWHAGTAGRTGDRRLTAAVWSGVVAGAGPGLLRPATSRGATHGFPPITVEDPLDEDDEDEELDDDEEDSSVTTPSAVVLE